MSPTRQLLVVMVGLPGSGKSHWARWLGATTGAIVLDKDVVKSVMVVSGEVDWKQSEAMAYEVLYALADDLLGQGKSVVVDSPGYYRNLQGRYAFIAECAAASLKLIECCCDDSALRDRRLASRGPMPSQRTSVAQLIAEYGRDGFEASGLPALRIDTSRGDDGLARSQITAFFSRRMEGVDIGPSLLRLEAKVGV